MSIKSISRLIACSLLLILANLNIHAQQYPKELQDEFKRPEAVQRAPEIPIVSRQLKKDKSFWKPYRGAFLLSTAVYWTGSGLDLASSRGDGFRESNPRFRNRDGSTAIGKNLAATAGIYAVTVALERKYPKFMAFIRTGVGVGRILFGALHNWQRY